MGCREHRAALWYGGVCVVLFGRRLRRFISVTALVRLGRIFRGLNLFFLLRTFRFLGAFRPVAQFSQGVHPLQAVGCHDILDVAIPVIVILQAEAFVVIIIAIVVPTVFPVNMAAAHVQVKPVVAVDRILYHDLLTYRDIDDDNDLLVTKFLFPVDRKSARKLDDAVGLADGEDDLAGTVEGGVGAAAQAAPQDTEVVAGIVAPEHLDLDGVQLDAIIVEGIEKAAVSQAVSPTVAEPPILIVIVVAVNVLARADDQVSMGGLNQREILFGMGAGPEVVDDHARQDDKADKADDPQGGEHIAQVVSLRTHAGDTADQPGQEGDDGYNRQGHSFSDPAGRRH